MAESENNPTAGNERVEQVARLKRELQGPQRAIEQFEAGGKKADPEEAEIIGRAYNHRRILEEQIKEVGTPAGSRDLGPLHVEWEVRGPDRVWVKLHAEGGVDQDFEMTSQNATSSGQGGLYSIRRYAINGAPHGTVHVNFPQGERPGSLWIAGEVLAVW